ncbi:TPA: hypothetical protein ACH27V_005862 [Klebsiella quasipneumoniae subsp. similipneumoniae]|uniref:hypothetical protein n=1 Tax=Klebsiella pneumoniae complex TaxID=3390273 RepID=UPI00164A9710|nr:hypothetical protein [Klebsiella quasipneumoniae]HBQ3047436.1 hypothetical protein [Klebsiella quasipneumoniae subsp. similipneumoniae]HBQ6295395.1 hypothetical protein [Klebsiella pneumoniae]MBC5080449.1 hypothetical protein [Klebsiella quasipneumoniae]HBQ6519833.1 hypothetical protein [Klebsiella pneumoniae]HBQ6756558.1 hypothetical protein [Klebsiella pneumoniae]
MTVLAPPTEICIYSDEYRPGTLQFLNFIETMGVKHGRKLEIDLSKVRFASAAASLLFFAVVNRAQLLTGDPHLIRFKWPKKEKNPEGHRWIVSTGLSRALLAGTDEKLQALTREERFFQSAVEPFEHIVETVTMLQRKAVLNDEQLDLLLTAISEALLNVSHHAYEDDAFKDDLLLLKGKRWWQCAWFNPEENRVVFIVCDLGLGIFKSFMPDDDGLSTQNEVSSVERAMLVGESRFVGSGRGNGSEDIKRPIGVGCVDDETLLILTGHARYNYNSNDSCPRCERLTEYIPGTLLQWSLVPRR